MKEMMIRSLRTFFEAALGYIAANLAVALADGTDDINIMKTALTGVLVSSVAAGIAAVLNMPKKA